MTNSNPAKLGNHAVTAVATPSIISEIIASTCSRIKMITAITPTARNPGISRTVCSKPMSAPSKFAASMTKLFSSALHALNAMGMVMPSRTRA